MTGVRHTYTLGRTCACGASLPDDGRVRHCDACKGARTREQNRIAVLRYQGRWHERIWWLYFRNAMRVAIAMREVLGRPDFEIPVGGNAALRAVHGTGGDWALSPDVLARVARAIGISVSTVEDAVHERPLARREFAKCCKWLGWPQSRFEHVARDVMNAAPSKDWRPAQGRSNGEVV